MSRFDRYLLLVNSCSVWPKLYSSIIFSIESFFKSLFFLGGGGVEDYRKITWVDWDSVCLAKKDGGLGVRKLHECNISLLGKCCWRILVDKDGLWHRVLKATYGEEGAN